MTSDSSSQVTSPVPAGVFISYAREDAEPARRIAESLRGFGIEVWFDLSELRGGDAWDAKIRTQVRTCTLFVAIISRTTQSRGEGYFRREWKLAVERTHDMADSVPFLVPVVIDDTSESTAIVPEQFMRVQWTRLQGGLPTPKFVEQVSRLLERTRTGSPQQGIPATPASASRARSGGKGLSAAVAVAALAVLAAGYFALRKPPATQAAPVSAPAQTLEAKAAPEVDSKSVAVLPFANMSDEKDSAFFADGIHEDILTNLALVRDLHVISRTSVMQYRDTTKPIRQIARELGVAYVLEGSVRRSGNEVRVTGQLIDGRTDEHVWAKMYDRNLTDVFTIQGELAQEIATSLHTAISPETAKLIDRKRTESPAAYDLWLKARALGNSGDNGVENLSKRVELLSAATDLDPNFAEAWGDLAVCHALERFWGFDTSEARMAQAKTALENAQRLSADTPEVISDVGTYYYYGFRDYDRATREYLRLKALRPNDSGVYFSLGLIARRKGDWWTSTTYFEKAARLDPANGSIANALVQNYESLNRYDEANALLQRIISKTNAIKNRFDLAGNLYTQTGDPAKLKAWLTSLTPEEAESPVGIQYRKDYAFALGDAAEYIRLYERQPYDENSVFGREGQLLRAATAYSVIGDKAQASAMARKAEALLTAKLAVNDDDNLSHLYLALAEALLGKRTESRTHAERALAIMPLSLDHLDGAVVAEFVSGVQAWNGEHEAAIRGLETQLRTPGGFTAAIFIRHMLFYAPICDDPRVEAWTKDRSFNAVIPRPPEFPEPPPDLAEN